MRKNKVLICVLSVTLVLAIAFGGCALYVSDYYRADNGAIAAFAGGFTSECAKLDGVISYGTGKEDTAFIFYPGGKVEYTAYAPLMQALAEQGIFCVALEMPFNLAVLDMDAADGIREKYPDIENWYIGGHSLGGTIAADHLAGNSDKYRGLVLLASYSTKDLANADIAVLSIYGSEDGVLNRQKYELYKKNMPKNFTETVIIGGNHAYFGMYGAQKGDGEPALTAEKQILTAAAHISDFLKGE